MEKHTLMGGKLHVYKRPGSSVWQCSTYLAGKNRRVTTKDESLKLAKEFAEDWYLGLPIAAGTCTLVLHIIGKVDE